MILEQIFGTINPSAIRKSEERTKRLKELFLNSGSLSESEILDRMRQAGVIKQGFFGTMCGRYLVRTICPLNESGGVIGYYFHKTKDGKRHLTYAGGMDF